MQWNSTQAHIIVGEEASSMTWLIQICDMTHLHMWHDSLIHVTWLIHTCDTTHLHMWHDSLIPVTWLIHTCDTTHLHTCDITHVTRLIYTHVTWLIDTCDMTHWYMWHDSLIHTGPRQRERLLTIWSYSHFSKVSFVVILHGKLSGVLTFENIWGKVSCTYQLPIVVRDDVLRHERGISHYRTFEKCE